jgi:hypothetical protein
MATLLAPWGLAALAAWLLPLLLHLRRRQDVAARLFAAWRWVRPAPRAARRWRIERWGLLGVRLLLLAVLALLLAGLAGVPTGRIATHVLLAPGISPAQATQAGAPSAATWHRWQAGTPERAPTGAADPATPGAGAATDLRQLDARLPASARLLVVVPEWYAGADGARVALTHSVEWRIVPGARPVPVATAAPPPRVAMRVTAGLRDEARYLEAALQAWPAAVAAATSSRATPASTSASAPVVAAPDVPLPDDADVLVWFVPGRVPAAVVARVEAGARVVLAAQAQWPAPLAAVPRWRDAAGRPWLETASVGRGRVLRFVHPLQASRTPALLDPGFARRLRETLSADVDTPALVRAVDYAPTTRAAAAATRPVQSWSSWLALLAALVFLCERWLATRSPRRAEPTA